MSSVVRPTSPRPLLLHLELFPLAPPWQVLLPLQPPAPGPLAAEHACAEAGDCVVLLFNDAALRCSPQPSLSLFADTTPAGPASGRLFPLFAEASSAAFVDL